MRRRRYLAYLEERREMLRDAERERRDRAMRLTPPVRRLLHIVSDPTRLWERRRTDADFLRVRLGTAALPVRAVRIRDGGALHGAVDPVALAAAHKLIRRFGRSPGLPLEVDLDRAGDVSIVGRDRADVLPVARAIVMQTAACHAPDDVTLVVLIRPELEADWAWARWLPHLLDRRRSGPDGPWPLLVPDARTLDAVLGDDLADRMTCAASGNRRTADRVQPRLLVIDDAHGRTARSLPTHDGLGLPSLGITIVHLLSDTHHEPRGVARRITVAGSSITVAIPATGSPVTTHGIVDDAPAPLLEGMARRIAPLRLMPDINSPGTAPADTATVLGLSHTNTTGGWHARDDADVLRVPIGLDLAGRPVLLDLKGPARHGAGPHGLCVGAPGSGKSELLRTLVLALITTHSPEQLSVLLMHGTGGKTFAPFTGLPHVAGIIDDLAANPSHVKRLRTCLESELHRRAASDDPPYLLVVVDDAEDVLTTRPEFAELIRRIGQASRVHLLVSITNPLMPSETKDLFAYRIAFRMLSEKDSRAALSTPDACYLPPRPGSGVLVTGDDPTRFTAAHVSAPLVDESEVDCSGLVRLMPRFGLPPPNTAAEELVVPTPTTGPTLLTTTAARLVGTGNPVHPIWLRPLPPAVTLDEVGDVHHAEHGAGGTFVPFGLLDDPALPSQSPWLVDLAGHLLVLGGPASGKTTALRTLALGIATTRTPAEVTIYGVDLCGTKMRALLGVPHVRDVTDRADREQLLRTVDQVHRAVNREHQQGEIVLLVDGWDRLHEFADVGPRLRELLARGGRCGIHIVAAASRWSALPAAEKDAFGARIELRLAAPAESSIDPDLAWAVPASQPGRGLTTAGLLGQIALPRLDGRSDPASSGIAHAAKLIDDSLTLPETNASAPTSNRSESQDADS
jgi:S-DNA-T family DNA segregation ATPase FtsK/SpoIIIE